MAQQPEACLLGALLSCLQPRLGGSCRQVEGRQRLSMHAGARQAVNVTYSPAVHSAPAQAWRLQTTCCPV